MRLILFVCVLFLCQSGFGQAVFEGRITNEQKEPLAGIMVTLKKDVSGPALTFAATNAEGYYKITFKGNSDSLIIFAQAMSYREQSRIVLEGNSNYDFILQYAPLDLEEIRVVARVSSINDTLSYSVDFFTQEGDRTLAEVMKRIPGLEVSQTGRVTYQGNPIENYYIEGLDLLGDGYGLANNNLLAERVDRIQVLENHQSLRMLEGVLQSDRTSLNIKLKNKHTVTMPVTAGAGVSPLMWLGEFLPMVFSPNRQFIGGFKANNTGKDISIDGLQHNSLEDLIADQLSLARTDIIRVNSPVIAANRYRFNKSAYATVNSLTRVKKDLQLRLNVWYLSDHLRMNGENETRYNLHDEEIIFWEDNTTFQKNNKLLLEANLFENSKDNFFKNALQMTLDSKKSQGDLLTQNALLDQNAQSRVSNLNNDFGYLLKAGSQLIQIASVISYKNIPQSLIIINNGYLFPFSSETQEVFQEVNDKKLNTDLMFRTFRKIGAYNFSWRAGGELKQEEMESLLSADGSSYDQNDLHWKESKLMVDQQIERTRENWQFRVNLPLAYHTFQIKDDLHDTHRRVSRFPFEPSLSFKYIFPKDWEMQTSIRRSYRFGTIENIHKGFILQDYKSLNRREGPLMENVQNTASLTLKYHNPFKYFNGWLTGRYSLTERNSITSSQIHDNGGITSVVFDQKNPLQNIGVNGTLRYIFPVGDATLAFQSGWNRQNSQVILNDRIAELQNNTLDNRLGWALLLGKKINLKVDHILTRTDSRSEGSQISIVFYQNHQVEIRYPVNQKHFLWTKGEYYNFKVTDNRTHASFWDIGYRYTLKKIEMEAQWQNILNKDLFRTGIISSYSTYYQSVSLRPSGLLLTFRRTFAP